jgi:putative iron-dependent peroxidase
MTPQPSFVLPQLGIFAQGTSAHYFLEFDLHPDVPPPAAVERFRGLRAPEVSAGGVNLVIGVAARPWRDIASVHDTPHDLADFRPIEGPDGRAAPAAQHDAWLWISGWSPDAVWDHARAAADAVSSVAAVASERPAFTYHDGRDMTGFVDGTANPTTRRAPRVALIPPGRPGEGGSHVLVMRWVHDLDAFHRLPVADQERVFGRTKPDSVELAPGVKPPTAHIARVEVDDESGEELSIYRRSVPYGTVAEAGLLFVAFSFDRARFDRLLARMFGTSGDGLTDRLTDFSRPVGGACYFAPSLNALDDVAGGD